MLQLCKYFNTNTTASKLRLDRREAAIHMAGMLVVSTLLQPERTLASVREYSVFVDVDNENDRRDVARLILGGKVPLSVDGSAFHNLALDFIAERVRVRT
jgi:hypothetical protein